MSENRLIIVTSFGTSHRESIDYSLGEIEQAISNEFQENEVRRAFTSRVILNILKEKEDVYIEHIKDALERAAEEKIESVIVQPTHFLKGNDFKKLEEQLLKYKDKFKELLLGEPLLSSEYDFVVLAEALLKQAEPYNDDQTAICFVGHGVDEEKNEPYRLLQEQIRMRGISHYYVGTLKGSPTKEMVLSQMQQKGIYKKIVLLPLMIVSGAHAIHEMAGDEEGSWKYFFEQFGYKVECVQKGLGEYPQVQKLFVKHIRDVIPK